MQRKLISFGSIVAQVPSQEQQFEFYVNEYVLKSYVRLIKEGQIHLLAAEIISEAQILDGILKEFPQYTVIEMLTNCLKTLLRKMEQATEELESDLIVSLSYQTRTLNYNNTFKVIPKLL
jgi:hypothetical protein